jgi:hypothetical protein
MKRECEARTSDTILDFRLGILDGVMSFTSRLKPSLGQAPKIQNPK